MGVVFRAGYTTTNSAISGAHRRVARARVRFVSGPTTARAGGARPGLAGSDAREERERGDRSSCLLSLVPPPRSRARTELSSNGIKRGPSRGPYWVKSTRCEIYRKEVDPKFAFAILSSDTWKATV